MQFINLFKKMRSNQLLNLFIYFHFSGLSVSNDQNIVSTWSLKLDADFLCHICDSGIDVTLVVNETFNEDKDNVQKCLFSAQKNS